MIHLGMCRTDKVCFLGCAMRSLIAACRRLLALLVASLSRLLCAGSLIVLEAHGERFFFRSTLIVDKCKGRGDCLLDI